MKKALKFLNILQIVSNQERLKRGLDKLGLGYSSAYRLNPYNPLSYITILIILILGIIMFGFYGFWEEVDIRNPFKWN